jgi:ABC-type Fe3+-hydroxamate transport system substrate-binding protein
MLPEIFGKILKLAPDVIFSGYWATSSNNILPIAQVYVGYVKWRMGVRGHHTK